MTDGAWAILSVVIALVCIAAMALIRNERAHKRARQAVPPGSAKGTMDVLSWLMKIDAPPDALGDTWLDGVHEGIYLSQRYLMGKAQGLAIQGDYGQALEFAKAAVALNEHRRVEETEHG